MKKGIFAILAMLTVLAMIMASCGGGGGGSSKKKKGDPDTNVVLSSISIGTAAQGDQNVAPGSAYSDEGLDGLDTFADVNVKWAAKDTENIEVTLTKGDAFNGQMHIIKIAKDGDITEADFNNATKAILYADGDKPKYKFADDDEIYVRMTSKDKTVVRYYGFKVAIGGDATLSSITFTADSKIYNATLGQPQNAVANFPVEAVGKMQFTVDEKTFKVKATGVEATAITLGKDGTTFNADTNDKDITFEDGDNEYLYVKVVSPSGKATKYYKIQVLLLRTATIKLGNGVSVSLTTIDSKWATADWLPINRINTTETQAIMEVDAKERSFGRAKLLFDAEGVYIWAQVWEKTIPDEDNAHNTSSIELFINEKGGREGTVASGVNENGGQYRLGARGTRTAAQPNQLDAFNALNKSAAKVYAAGALPASGDNKFETERETTLTSGYEVMFQAPWLFMAPAAAEGKVALLDQTKITLEIQINATGTNGRRNGVLNWNSASSNSYNSVANFGAGVLDFASGTLGAFGPTITTQPKGGRIALDEEATEAVTKTLTVVATSPDDGSLSYQWYSVDDDGTENIISGKTDATYEVEIDVTEEKEFSFYVVVTNTKGGSSVDRKSNVATFKVYDATDLPAEVNLLTSPLENVELKGDYGTIGTYNYTVGLADYKLEIYYEGTGLIDTGANSNDFYLQIYDPSGAQIQDSTGYEGTQYNATASIVEGGVFKGTWYNLSYAAEAGLGGGSSKIEVKNKGDGANEGKIVKITAIKLVLKD
jgi:hypothetical protein